MTEYTKIDTTGHIKQFSVLGTDPVTSNIVIEMHCGQLQATASHRLGAFSISPEELKQFLRQAVDELAEAAATKIHNA